MKNIYIAFLASNYRIGKAIRVVTKYKYSHVTISESENISQMYSFARKFKNTPFVAGFVCENLSRYTIGKGKTPVKVCRVELSDDEYAALEEKLEAFRSDPEKYKYNYFSAVGYIFRRQWKKKTAFTCIEFVSYLLGIDSFITISELEKMLKEAVVYEGTVEEIAKDQQSTPDKDPFFEHKSVAYQAKVLAADITALVKSKRRK